MNGQRLFMLRTGNIYRHQRDKAKASKATLNYDIAAFRRRVKKFLTVGLCAYCHAVIDPKTWQADHSTPISRGGLYSIDNIVICCQICNQVKGTLTAKEYMQLLKVISQWQPIARQSIEKRLRAGARIVKC